MQKETTGFTYLFIAACFFGISSIFIRFLAEDFTDLQQAMARMLLAGILAALVSIFTNRKGNSDFCIDKNDFKKWQFYVYLVSFPLSLICVTISLNLIQIASTIFFLYIGKLSSSLIFDLIVFKESISLRKIRSVIFLTLGMIIFLNPFDGLELNAGIIYALAGGLAASVDGTCKKIFAERMENWFLISTQMTVGAAMAALMLVLSPDPNASLGTGPSSILNLKALSLEFNPTNIALILASGLIILGAQVFMLLGFRKCGINLGTIILSLELIAAMIIGFLVFQETVSPYQMLGALFIIITVINRNASDLLAKKQAVDTNL